MNANDRKRLAIFCLYAPDGIVRFRVTYILRELLTVSDEIIIVSNGDLSEAGKDSLRGYTDTLIIRDNIGFDGGAYADVILNHLGKEKLKSYSSLILCNDSFWGPFVPLTDIFTQMEKTDTDWWGLNRIDADFLSYIQSYLLFFDSSVLKNEALYDFFEGKRNQYITKQVYDIYIHFELDLYRYMKSKGYSEATYTFANNACIYESPYQCYAKYDLPILKCKALGGEYYKSEQISAILYVIAERSKYPIDEIINEIKDVFGYSVMANTDAVASCVEVQQTIPDYSEQELIHFSEQYNNTYLYGSGLLGQKINHTLGRKLHNLQGFLISDEIAIYEETVMGLPVIHFSERLNGSCVIVALDRHHSKQVYDKIGNDGSLMYLKQQYNPN